MDKFNVINQTSDLQSLERDMMQWSMMPFKFRMMSDDDCMRLHGMTNTDYYNHVKAYLISKRDNKDLAVRGDLALKEAVTPQELFQSEDYDEKYETSQNLQRSPFIIIIDPWKISGGLVDNTYTMEALTKKFDSFLMLSDKNRRFSNEYSLQLWGYNVYDMFDIMKNIVAQHNQTELKEEEKFTIGSTNEDIIAIEKLMTPLVRTSNHMIVEDDKIGLCNVLLNTYCTESLYGRNMIEEKDIKEAIECKDYASILPSVTPYFTVDEMKEFAPESTIGEMTYDDWYNALKIAVQEKDEEKLLNLGWNPSVDFNQKNCEFARNRQIFWLKEHAPTIVDIQGLNEDVEEVVSETSSMMKKLYDEQDLYPIYIVSSYTNTFLGKMEKIVLKNITYSHAGLSLNSDLKNIFTFEINNDINGFVVESIDDYKKLSDKSIIDVLCLFVDKKTQETIAKNIELISSSKTKYNVGNLINILLKRAKQYPYPENLQMVCSQFVDTILKIANIDITNKPSNLVIPQDFAEISKNPKVYRVFQGYCKDYKEHKVERDIMALFMNDQVKNIKYGDRDFVKESYNTTATNEILEKLNWLTTPEAVISERKLPFRFNSNGDITIDLYKNLEQQYQETHKLLTGYDEKNLEGIKHELAHMFYLNSVIENKIKKMKKSDSKYKELINLRARILNDFKKYFKVVTKAEPDFDFTKYFQDSEYYNGSVTIDRSTLKYSGKLIKQFLLAQGV